MRAAVGTLLVHCDPTAAVRFYGRRHSRVRVCTPLSAHKTIAGVAQLSIARDIAGDACAALSRRRRQRFGQTVWWRWRS